jgi:hypothetical protein
MKAIKGVSLIFAGLIILVSSCFNPPEFGLVPEIEYESIFFAEAPAGSTKTDSIVVSIKFKDGDGDLGLDPENPIHAEYPFHPSSFFLAKDGKVEAVALSQHWSDIQYYFIDVVGQEGKLVTAKTREQAAYNFLPPYTLNSCSYLADTVIMVDSEDAGILDVNYQNIIDTMTSPNNPPIYVLKDTFYIEANPNHYNITVDFLLKNGDNTWTPFAWEDCNPSYSGRFPVLSDEPNSPLDGVLRYSLKSQGFRIMFTTKTLKLRIKIRDRALNTSNVIETPEFTLDKIRR